MPAYSVTMQRTASTTLAVGDITASASGRFKLYDVIVGSEAAAADGSFLWRFQKHTTSVGTRGSTVTPQSLDSADGAATSAAGQAHTANPTVTANAFCLDIPLNQRATFRWVAAPGGELVAPATANSGFTILTPTSSAVAVTAICHIME